MNSVQERLKLKRVPIDTWSTKEKLCLASAVLRSGDQNWMSVSRALRLFGEPGRPIDWFSQKSCALQYGNLLENVDTPKRKKRTDKSGSEHVETPGEAIVRNLTHERINELKKLLQEERAMYLKLKEEVAHIRAGQIDDRLGDMCQQIAEEEKQKERDVENHKRWLLERQEKKNELERAWKPPVTPASPHRKKLQRGLGGNRRNSSQSEPSSEADSPLSEPLNVDVIGDEAAETKPPAPTPTSPLLTSLLKSPSPAPSAQSSILHSAITSVHHRGASSSPTIASLLHSSPGIPAPGAATVAPPPAAVSSSLKNLVTSAIGADDAPKPPSTSPAAGAPTLSMLLELPPSLPGKPLPELPVSSVAKPPLQHLPPSTSRAGEVCHPQHQEMRVRRELGTDEPVEVVAVEEHPAPNLREQVVGMEVVVGTQDVMTSRKLLDEELEDVSQAIANVEKMEMEKQKAEAAAAAVAAATAAAAAAAAAAAVAAVVPTHCKLEADIKEERVEEFKQEEKKPEQVPENVKPAQMNMPVAVERASAEPQTVAEVVEVPAAAPVPATGDLDIIIVDSSNLGGQEEVPPDSECQVVEVVLDGKPKQEEPEQPVQPVVKVEREDLVPVVETVTAKEDGGNPEVRVVGETAVEETKDFPVDESSRIEVVAIEMPPTKAAETSKVDEKQKQKEKNVKVEDEKAEEGEVKKEGEQVVTAVEEEKEEEVSEMKLEKTVTVTDDAKEEGSADEAKESEKDEDDSSDHAVEDSDVRTEEASLVPQKDEAVEDSSDEKFEDEAEKEADAEATAKAAESSEEEREVPVAVAEEVKHDEAKEVVRKEPKKRITAEDRLDAIAEDIMSETYEAAEKASEATEEDDSRAESSEDEKKVEDKSWVVAEEAAEEPISTGGKKWKEEDEEELEDKADGADELKQLTPHKAASVQKTGARADTPSTEDDKTNDAAEPPRGNRRRGAAATPVDSVPNSPAAPLTDEDREYRAWKKAIMLVYGRLATHKYASLFLRPITDDQAPGYSSIVHRPIDLLTIKKNIELGVTRSTAEFQRDVMLMFLNSIMYNKSSHFVHKMARQMQQEGMQHVQDFLTTQMLVQVVGEAPLRRETRTTEANKQRDFLSTPGSSSQDETDGPSSQNNKRKRAEPDRNSVKKRKVAVDE